MVVRLRLTRCLILIVPVVIGGCGRLAAGPVNALSKPAPPVVLIRGYQDWYSTGIDRLGDELRAAGVPAAVYREEQWGDVAEALPPGGVVLVGFSYGADDVILISRKLAEKHQAVDLLITIDPVTPAAVSGNVRRCVNFYEPNGVWDLFPWLRGVPLHADSAGVPVENIDVKTRPDLVVDGTSHGTIAANPNVHRAIVRLVTERK